MKIVNICGKAGVGKTTFALKLKKFLEENNNKKVLVAAYADRLKQIAKDQFGWDGQKDEKGRHLLQWLGTDVIRKKDPDFHVRSVYDLANLFEGEYDIIIVADCRFPNEIEFWNETKFEQLYFRLNRDNYENKLNSDAQKHASEIALDNYEMPEFNISGNLRELNLYMASFILKNWEFLIN